MVPPGVKRPGPPEMPKPSSFSPRSGRAAPTEGFVVVTLWAGNPGGANGKCSSLRSAHALDREATGVILSKTPGVFKLMDESMLKRRISTYWGRSRHQLGTTCQEALDLARTPQTVWSLGPPLVHTGGPPCYEAPQSSTVARGLAR